MVKMSTIEFISNQNLILSSAAKNYEIKIKDSKFCVATRVALFRHISLTNWLFDLVPLYAYTHIHTQTYYIAIDLFI